MPERFINPGMLATLAVPLVGLPALSPDRRTAAALLVTTVLSFFSLSGLIGLTRLG